MYTGFLAPTQLPVALQTTTTGILLLLPAYNCVLYHWRTSATIGKLLLRLAYYYCWYVNSTNNFLLLILAYYCYFWITTVSTNILLILALYFYWSIMQCNEKRYTKEICNKEKCNKLNCNKERCNEERCNKERCNKERRKAQKGNEHIAEQTYVRRAPFLISHTNLLLIGHFQINSNDSE